MEEVKGSSTGNLNGFQLRVQDGNMEKAMNGITQHSSILTGMRYLHLTPFLIGDLLTQC